MNKRAGADYAGNAELIAAAQAGDENAAEMAVKVNMPLVRSIARRYSGRAELEDLIQIGSLGLLKAVRRFDTTTGVCFSTYAVPLIAGEIKRFLRDDGIIRVSRRLKETAAAAAKLDRHYAAEYGRHATINELERELMTDKSEIAAAMDAGLPCLSLDGMLEGEAGAAREPADRSEFESEALDRVLLGSLLTELEPLARMVIHMRYFDDKTQADTARALGLTQVQVSRLESRSINALRAAVQNN